MEDETKFITVFLAILIVLRIYIWMTPVTADFMNDNWHHIYWGMLLFGMVFLLSKQGAIVSTNKKIFFYAVAIALMADEAFFFVFPTMLASKASYFSVPSIIGTVFLSGMVTWKRKPIITKLVK